MPPLSVSVALMVLGVGAVTALTAMSQAVVVLFVSKKVIAEDALKCVQPLPVMITGTTVPDAPAPGDTTATAAGGLVAIAQPVSVATSADPPGAESVTVSEPERVGLGRIELGVKLT